MGSKTNYFGLVLLIFSVVAISGCSSHDLLNYLNPLYDVSVTGSDGVKHFEGKGISFNSPNTWVLSHVENDIDEYLFSIVRGDDKNLEKTDRIHFFAGKYDSSFFAGKYNGTSPEFVNHVNDFPYGENHTRSLKELTVDGLPAYQSITHDKNISIKICFMKNGIMYMILAFPRKDNNVTSIEPDLEMIFDTFHIT
ncbi:hypothetical protein [Methanobacterium ferruginis]|uniref:hypothetical protein n=1 Tax=Methanobacterium ferruginis TaxID=710191 RepID=UPI0025727795|nr:hypothetical protein [Methanobacterium ferruginis]BDZ67270.1 hypothetical protein GCM10025860_07180 [Methanobacterium ferruginis]